MAALGHVFYTDVRERASFRMLSIRKKEVVADTLWSGGDARGVHELPGGYFEEPALEVDFAAVSRGFDPGGDCPVEVREKSVHGVPYCKFGRL